MKFDVINSV